MSIGIGKANLIRPYRSLLCFNARKYDVISEISRKRRGLGFVGWKHKTKPRGKNGARGLDPKPAKGSAFLHVFTVQHVFLVSRALTRLF